MKQPKTIADLLGWIERAYSRRIEQCGPVANGVFWKDTDGQILRYDVLLQAITTADLNRPITINDLGCGYGALVDVLSAQNLLTSTQYYGYDISPKMIKAAKARNPAVSVQFIESPVAIHTADYSFVSGTYNMNFAADENLWQSYIFTSLERLWAKTTKVLAFNLLDRAQSGPSAPDSPLYYADRDVFIRFALSLSPEVEVIDDYPLDEFTLFIKRF